VITSMNTAAGILNSMQHECHNYDCTQLNSTFKQATNPF